MHLYSINGSIKKYNSINDILEEYFKERLNLYQKRKDYQLEQLQKELDLISYKAKFIINVIEKEIEINNRRKKILNLNYLFLNFQN